MQFKAIRKIQKGGIALETGTKSGANKVREIATKVPALRIAAPKKILPRLMVYDVDSDTSDEDFLTCLHSQNLEEHGVTYEELQAGCKIAYKAGRRDAETMNLVIEVEPKIRDLLLDVGRVYIDFASCRVVDHFSVSRCYRCQGYGHVSKVCKLGAGDSVCSHCGRVGHGYKDWRRSREKPSCANCLAAKKPSEHKVGTLECPMYRRLVEQRIAKTAY